MIEANDSSNDVHCNVHFQIARDNCNKHHPIDNTRYPAKRTANFRTLQDNKTQMNAAHSKCFSTNITFFLSISFAQSAVFNNISFEYNDCAKLGKLFGNNFMKDVFSSI